MLDLGLPFRDLHSPQNGVFEQDLGGRSTTVRGSKHSSATTESRFRDQGVGGSNPLSPTIVFSNIQTAKYDVCCQGLGSSSADCEPNSIARSSASAKATTELPALHLIEEGDQPQANSLLPPGFPINVLGDVNVGVSHVVTDHFGASPGTSEQTGVNDALCRKQFRVADCYGINESYRDLSTVIDPKYCSGYGPTPHVVACGRLAQPHQRRSDPPP
jgi:hypothetical protein